VCVSVSALRESLSRPWLDPLDQGGQQSVLLQTIDCLIDLRQSIRHAHAPQSNELHTGISTEVIGVIEVIEVGS
jgi:hypothetical protein